MGFESERDATTGLVSIEFLNISSLRVVAGGAVIISATQNSRCRTPISLSSTLGMSTTIPKGQRGSQLHLTLRWLSHYAKACSTETNPPEANVASPGLFTSFGQKYALWLPKTHRNAQRKNRNHSGRELARTRTMTSPESATNIFKELRLWPSSSESI